MADEHLLGAIAMTSTKRRRSHGGTGSNEIDSGVRNGNGAAHAPRAGRRKAQNAIRVAQPPSDAASHAAKTDSPVHAPSPAGRAGAGVRLDLTTVPQELTKRFVQVGREYYFPDGARAFSDRGSKLITPSENSEVVRSLIAIAQVRRWQEIRVSGSERFRSQAWYAGQLAGIAVRGYSPSALEQGQLVRALAPSPKREPMPERPARAVRTSKAQRGEKTSRSQSVRGQLIEHGRAPYRHAAQEQMSYFVKVKTARGVREIWGVDLERALRESLSRPEKGDQVSVWSVGRDHVVLPTRPQGTTAAPAERTAHRNRWRVEKLDFLKAREQAAEVVRNQSVSAAQAVQRHPELAGAYVSLRAAQLAAKRIADPNDRSRFMANVREALAGSVARGEPLPTAPLKVRGDRARRTHLRSTETQPAR